MRARVPGRTGLFVTIALLLAGLIAPAGWRLLAQGQEQPDASLSGVWTIDRESSQLPREIGFDADFIPSGRGDAGGRGLGGSALPALRPQGENYESARRRQVLTDEARLPSTSLTIVDTPVAVTITDAAGNGRTFHPDGRAETLEIGGVPVLTTARRESGALIVLYSVADLRQIRYTYARPPGTAALVVDTQFLERGTGDSVRRIYVPAQQARPAAATTDNGRTPPAGATPQGPIVPRAGSEFSGLTRMGIVVEEPSTQAVNCGITRVALESAVARHFTGIGLRVSTNSDEDTYAHVTVMTSTMPNGMCISRYDWSIYSMTEATLSHQRSPLLAQVLLAHKGGLTGSLPATHGADVIRGLDEGFAQIATIIRDANR